MVLGRKFFQEHGASSILSANIPDYLRRALRKMLAFPSCMGLRFGLFKVPFLGVHIMHVVVRGAKKQMIGADAARVIALVANIHAFRDRTTRQFIGNPMRRTAPILAIRILAPIDRAVSWFRLRPLPDPASIRIAAVHLPPESLGQRKPLMPICIGASAAAIPCVHIANPMVSCLKGLAALSARAGNGGMICGRMFLHGESPFAVPRPRMLSASLGHLLALSIPQSRNWGQGQ